MTSCHGGRIWGFSLVHTDSPTMISYKTQWQDLASTGMYLQERYIVHNLMYGYDGMTTYSRSSVWPTKFYQPSCARCDDGTFVHCSLGQTVEAASSHPILNRLAGADRRHRALSSTSLCASWWSLAQRRLYSKAVCVNWTAHPHTAPWWWWRAIGVQFGQYKCSVLSTVYSAVSLHQV